MNLSKNLTNCPNQQDRIAEVDSLIKKHQDGIDDYFDNKYNSSPKKDNSLNDKMCEDLDRLANYILFADDIKKIKKTEYNFYTVKQLREKFGNELSLEGLFERFFNESGENEPAIDFIINDGMNYKKSIEQKINKNDINDLQPVKDYQEYKEILSAKLKDLRETKQDKSLQKRIANVLKGLKTDQILCKDMLKGTIYFKCPLEGTENIDYDQYDPQDHSHISALLKCNNNDLSTDLGCLRCDLKNLIDTLNLNESDVNILNLYCQNKTTLEIANALYQKQGYVYERIKGIVRKISNQYMLTMADWYYTFVVKGVYKKCNICEKYLIASLDNFNKNFKYKDGLQNFCKNCS